MMHFNEVEIYSKTNCIFCDKAKIKLQKYNPKILMLDKDYLEMISLKNFQMLELFLKL